MKTNFLYMFSGVVMSFFMLSSFKAAPTLSVNTQFILQEPLVINAVYDGHEDYGYNFIYIDTEGDERTMTFQNVQQSILDVFDLDSETFIKTKFKISYTITVEESVDEDGNKSEDEIYTITKLEKI